MVVHLLVDQAMGAEIHVSPLLREGLAVALVGSAGSFLRDPCGIDKFKQVYDLGTQDPGSAVAGRFREFYGIDLDALEQLWRLHLRT